MNKITSVIFERLQPNDQALLNSTVYYLNEFDDLMLRVVTVYPSTFRSKMVSLRTSFFPVINRVVNNKLEVPVSDFVALSKELISLQSCFYSSMGITAMRAYTSLNAALMNLTKFIDIFL
jgi:hypothetical protein